MENKRKLRLSAAKQIFTKNVQENPKSGRTEIRRLDQASTRLVWQHDRAYYEEIMPERRRSGGRATDWALRDQEYHRRISAKILNLRTIPNPSTGPILSHLGLQPRFFEIAKGRAPKTHGLVKSLIKNLREQKTLERARARITDLIAGHPKLGRKELIILDGNAAKILRERDLAFWNRVTPPSRAKGRTPWIDWSVRDAALHHSISGVEKVLRMEGYVTVRAIQKKLGLPLHYLDCARGRLPKAESLIRSIIWRNRIDMRSRRDFLVAKKLSRFSG
jgi:hypothetical protein